MKNLSDIGQEENSFKLGRRAEHQITTMWLKVRQLMPGTLKLFGVKGQLYKYTKHLTRKKAKM